MSEQDLNKELEELLDAELTEDEVQAMEEEISQLDEIEEVGGVAKMKPASGKAKPAKVGGGEKSGLKDDSEDMGAAVTSPEDSDDAGGKASDKAKKAKPTNSAPSGDAPAKLAAGDEIEHDGEQLEEARMTKAKMLEDLGKMVEDLGKMKATDLKGIHERMKKIVSGDDDGEEVEESKESAELKELEIAKKDIEEKIKKISVKEDVEALIKGEDDLSEEFKEKAATIFEAAVKSKVRDEIEQLEAEYNEKLQEEVNQTLADNTEKVDSYLNYVVEEWMKQNEVGIEQKLKTEITENFITGLKGLFEEHNIVVPDEKYDVLDAAAQQADEMEAKLNEQVDKNIELSQRVAELEKGEILIDVASDLTDTEVEKFVGLAENVEYEDNDDYRKKLETIKESYFTRTVKDDEVEAAPIYDEQGDMSNQMAAYMSAISKSETRAQK
jgi:cell division protein FtsB